MTPDNPEMVVMLRRAKEYGFSDRQLAEMWKRPESDVRALRKATAPNLSIIWWTPARLNLKPYPLLLLHL